MRSSGRGTNGWPELPPIFASPSTKADHLSRHPERERGTWVGVRRATRPPRSLATLGMTLGTQSTTDNRQLTTTDNRQPTPNPILRYDLAMRKLLALLLLLLASAAFAQKSADEVAKRAVDMLAGPAWDGARYIAFTFD